MFIKLQDGSLLNLNYVKQITIKDDKHGMRKVVMAVDSAKTKNMDLIGDISEEVAVGILDCIYEIDLTAMMG